MALSKGELSIKEIEHRALLGDQQAQEECTRREIALPCPCCGAAMVKEAGWFYHPNVMCILGLKSFRITDTDLLSMWNRRPAPPIGLCRECKYWTPRELDGGKTGMCVRYTPNGYEFSQRTAAGFYCGDFKPKEDVNRD